MKIFKTVPCFKEETAVALGFFDGVHIAHQKVISLALESGYIPVVLTFSVDRKIPGSKGDLMLLNDAKTKQDLIEKLGVEVLVSPPFRDIQNISAEDFFSEYLVKRLNAKILTCGENFRFGKGALGDVELLKNMSKKSDIKVLPVEMAVEDGEIVSSSRVRKALARADLKTVKNLLGRNYFWTYLVSKGEKNGRKIGYPTINQQFPVECIIPRSGVYVSKVRVEGKEYLGVSNIGIRPSVSVLRRPIAETHIVDFCGKELYGKRVLVTILNYIRPEKKFDSIQELKNQISEDVKFAKKLKNKLQKL